MNAFYNTKEQPLQIQRFEGVNDLNKWLEETDNITILDIQHSAVNKTYHNTSGSIYQYYIVTYVEGELNQNVVNSKL